MAQRAREVLLDPERVAMWSRFQALAAQGARALHQWGPHDGLPFASPLPAHQHTVPTLTVCLSGRIRIEGRATIDLLPGDLLLIEPGCWHRHQPYRHGATAFALGFLAGRCDMIFFEQEAQLWGAVPEQPYHGLVTALLDERQEGGRLRLVDEILRGITRERVDFLDWIQPGMLAMAEWLWQRLHLRVEVDAVLAHGGLGRTAGFRLFKEFFGRTPKQELLAQRVALARHLVRRGLPFGEVATRSGFASRAGMTRAFHRRLGHAPSAEPLPISPRRAGRG
jgi:AraC-like DNA-binding protein